ncbi:hypothetical protein AGLY_000962 [Aphis glycines]|uniref:Uncharacterized protein n=1 Tax=Aphis glycines TaxID=307491 RepID=A0A6G0U9Z4_APHGL|nr:hypothetical protein AGLY_000962 [Aphis glycines]
MYSYNFLITQNKKFDFDENWFCVKIPVFPSFFFLFFSIFLKTVGKCLLFTSIMHQGYSLFHRKPPPKFEIEALFRLVMLYTDKKKKKTYIIVKLIHSSLRSESKTIKKRTDIMFLFTKRSFVFFTAGTPSRVPITLKAPPVIYSLRSNQNETSEFVFSYFWDTNIRYKTYYYTPPPSQSSSMNRVHASLLK